MKPLPKFPALLLLTGTFALASSFSSVTGHHARNINTGIFKTYDDYVKDNLIVYNAITLKQNTFKGVLKDGKKIPATAYKDADFWGAEDEDGVIYRINKAANIADRIISNGKIFYYSGLELTVGRNNYGDLTGLDIKAPKGTKFSQIFWVSVGGEGEMLPASMDNLTKLFADSPDLIAKLKKNGMDETNVKKWVDTFTYIASLIGEYDKAHK